MTLRRTQAVNLKSGKTVHVLPREIPVLKAAGLLSKDTKARKPAKVTTRKDAQNEALRKIEAKKKEAQEKKEFEAKAIEEAREKEKAEAAEKEAAEKEEKEKDQKDPGKTKEEKDTGGTKEPEKVQGTANITSPKHNMS